MGLEQRKPAPPQGLRRWLIYWLLWLLALQGFGTGSCSLMLYWEPLLLEEPKPTVTQLPPRQHFREARRRWQDAARCSGQVRLLFTLSGETEKAKGFQTTVSQLGRARKLFRSFTVISQAENTHDSQAGWLSPWCLSEWWEGSCHSAYHPPSAVTTESQWCSNLVSVCVCFHVCIFSLLFSGCFSNLMAVQGL